MATLKKLINKAQLKVLVPEQQAAVIERDGQIDRLETPGYISYNRFSEKITGFIKTGPQQPVKIELSQIRSLDGYPVDVRCQIGWSFEPHRCNFHQLPHLIRQAPEIQANIITSFGTRIVRDIVGSLTAAQLRLGQTPAEVEFQIKTKLYTKVRFAGIILFPPTVEQLSPPSSLDTTLRQADEQRVRLEIDQYQKQAQAEIDASAKRIETEMAGILRGIEAEAEASANRVLAEAEAHQQKLRAKIAVQEQAARSRITSGEMERRYKWLASESLELAETVADAEKFKTIAEKAPSINLVAPLPATFGTPFVSSFVQPLANTNGHHNNGK